MEDKRSMMTLLQAVDRAGGYAFGSAEGANDTVWQVAMREGMRGLEVGDVQERWIDRKEEFDETERVEREEARGKLMREEGRGEEGEGEMDELEPGSGVDMSGIKVVRKG